MDKQKTIIILLSVLLFLFLAYFIYDIFGQWRSATYLQGYRAAVNELVLSAENESCEPFSVYTDEKNIQLINVECLMSQEEE